MQLRKPMVVGAWVLIALNLALALGAIALLVRMSPAIADIIERNDRSLAAGEQMLAAVARGMDPEARAAFESALTTAEGNITEPEERVVLHRLRELQPALPASGIEMRDEAVATVLQLNAINRQAMREADLDAQQLGTAGAWGVVFMGLLSFIAGLLFIRRLDEYLLLPLQELVEVIAASRSGDQFRRCPAAEARGDFQMIYAEVNGLLDERRWHERLFEDRLRAGDGPKSTR